MRGLNFGKIKPTRYDDPTPKVSDTDRALARAAILHRANTDGWTDTELDQALSMLDLHEPVTA